MVKVKIVFESRENALSAYAYAENELDFQPMIGRFLRRKGPVYDEISLSRTTLTVSCCRPTMNYHSSVSQIRDEALSCRCLSIADQIVGGLSALDELPEIRLVTISRLTFVVIYIAVGAVLGLGILAGTYLVATGKPP